MKLLLFLTLLTSIAGQYTLQAMDYETMAAMHHAHMRDNVDNRENPHFGGERERDPEREACGCCIICCCCVLHVLSGVHEGVNKYYEQRAAITQTTADSQTIFNPITPPPAYSSHPYSSYKFAQSQFSTDLCAADESDENMPDKKDK